MDKLSSNKLSCIFPEVPITDAFLVDVTNILGPVYYQLGIILNVQRPDILRLESNYNRDVWRVTYEVLVKWNETSKNRSNGEAMIAELVEALTRLDLVDVAERIKRGECWNESCINCNII